MIIRSIAVAGFGRFADPVSIGPFAEGVNLVHAPNGVGKSTLLRALGCGLMDSYTVKSAELQAWKPWGRGLVPRITLEFDHFGVSYRLEKQFLDKPKAILYRKDGAAWTEFMGNEAADKFVRGDVLNCTPPGSGLAKQKHWGLAQILWTTQGDLVLPELSGNVVESIQRSVGAALTAAGSKLEANLAALYERFYTPGKGALKKGCPLGTFEGQFSAAQTERSAAETELAEYEVRSAEIESLRQSLSARNAERQSVDEQCKAARALVERYKELNAKVAQLREAANARGAVYLSLKKHIEGIAAARADAAKAQAAVTAAQAKRPETVAKMEATQKAAYAAKELHAVAVKSQKHAASAQATARTAAEYLGKIEQLATAAAAIARVDELDTTLRELAANKAGLHAPTAGDLRAIRDWTSKAATLQTQLDAARITAEITPIHDAIIRVTDGDRAGEIHLRASEPASIAGSPNLTFEIPGFGVIRVRGPLTNYAETRTQLDTCRTKLAAFEQQYGTSDPDRLEALRAAAEEIGNRIKLAEKERSAILGKQNLQALLNAHAQLGERITAIEQAHPEWKETRPDPKQLETAAGNLVRSADETEEQTRAACEAATHAFNEADKALSALDAALAAERKNLNAAQGRLNAAVSDGLTDAERAAKLDHAALEYHAAQAAHTQDKTALEQLGGDPAPRLALLEASLTELDLQSKDLNQRIIQAETKTQILVSHSPYDHLVAARENESRIAAALQRERRRMAAIKLLNEVMAATKAELIASVAEPVEAAANANLRAICPKPVATVRVTSGLTVAEIRPAADPETVAAVTQLSGGEKEQLYLATRLALAEELAKSERQLLVLDDVLTFTDHDRMKRICDLLTRASEKLQILILTCHPERFLDIAAAKPFDLEAVIRAKAVV